MARCLVQQSEGFKTASTEPGGLNEKRSNEVNSVCTAGRRGEESVRQGASSQGTKSAQTPPSLLPRVPQPCSEDRGLGEGSGGREFSRKKVNPCRACSLGGIPGEMASICLDGWVCDSGDVWARGGDLGTLWVHRWASREQNGFRPTCPLGLTLRYSDQPARPQVATRSLRFSI